MKIYTTAKNTQSTDLGFVLQLILVGFFLFTLTVTAQADSGYECEMQHDGKCIVYLEDVLAQDANVSVALQYCDDINGVYNYEQDTCEIE